MPVWVLGATGITRLLSRKGSGTAAESAACMIGHMDPIDR